MPGNHHLPRLIINVVGHTPYINVTGDGYETAIHAKRVHYELHHARQLPS